LLRVYSRNAMMVYYVPVREKIHLWH